MGSVGFCFFLVLTVLSDSLANKTASSNGVYVKVLGQSGKIMIGQKENPSDDPNSVKVEFSEIKEKDSNGTAVGASGQQKHSFNTFANQDFSFSDVVNGSYQNLSAMRFSFTANLTSVSSQLVTVVYIFTQGGNITVGNETTEVEAGTVKFNIEIKNWAFCGTNNISCKQGQTNETGALIDFEIDIKGNGNATMGNKTDTKNGTRGDNYDLGGGTKIIMSKKVKYDGGNWTDMADGYPKLTSTGDKQMFTFRFVKFSQSVLYDPTIKLGQDNTNTSVNNGSATGEEKTLGEGKVYAKVLGKSGKITIGGTNNPMVDPNRVTIELDALQELTSNGTEITDNDHSFNTFANQDFTFTSLINTKFQNINVSMFSFNATIGTLKSMVLLSVYIFKEAGEINMGGENTTVRTGTVKFNTEISGWKFCSNVTICKQSVNGEYLDLHITIKGKGDKPEKLGKKKFSNGDEYNLGGSSYLVMSKKVKLDGNWTDMPSGYPMLMQHGSKQTFVIRIKKFSNNAFYDPNVEFSTADDSINGAITHISSMTLYFVIAILSLCFTLFGIFN